MLKANKVKALFLCCVLSLVLIYTNSFSGLAMGENADFMNDGFIRETYQSEITMVSFDLLTGEREEVTIMNPLSEREVMNGTVLDAPGYMPPGYEASISGMGGGTVTPFGLYGGLLVESNPYVYGVAHIRVNFQGTSQVSEGSAFVFADKALLTAAHVLDLGYPIVSIEIRPSRDGSSYPFGTIMATKALASQEWLNGNHTESNDFAILEIDTSLTNQTGLFGWTTNMSVGTPIRITGYPKVIVNNRQTYKQYTSSGSITGLTTGKVSSNNTSTDNGGSGGPFYIHGNGFQAVAISARDTGENNGCRITPLLAAILSTYR
ncbi:MAG: trypsin-like serine protease [Oscillospiraceae bacterium]|nr:trypsin-like serine protease [Oscillospiraceae bacterium]